MGWTWQSAKHMKNGRIDRKAECDDNINCENLTVLKSAMVGTTYYAAVKSHRTNEVFAAIFLTSTNKDDIFNFGYKDMDETEGPYRHQCPTSILKLLSTTDNETAMAWRRQCWENACKKKNATHMHYGKSYKVKARHTIAWVDGYKLEKGDEVTVLPMIRKKGWYIDARGHRTFTRGDFDVIEEL